MQLRLRRLRRVADEHTAARVIVPAPPSTARERIRHAAAAEALRHAIQADDTCIKALVHVRDEHVKRLHDAERELAALPKGDA